MNNIQRRITIVLIETSVMFQCVVIDSVTSSISTYHTKFTRIFSGEYLDNGWQDIRKILQRYVSNNKVSSWQESFRYIKQSV